MPGATTQTLLELLQKNYQPGITRQFNADFPLLRFIRQNSDDISAEGEEAVIALETGLNEGGGFHGESADVAESGSAAVEQAKVRLKQITFRVRITFKLMRKARTNAAAFARGLQTQMTATRDAFTLTGNSYLWGDGSGVMARVQSETIDADDKLILDRAYGVADGGTPESIIRKGQVLHILDTKGYEDGVSVDRGMGEVEAVDMTIGGGAIEVRLKAGHTLDSAGVAADDYVYLQNTIEGWVDPGEVEDNRPAMGMLGFYDDSLTGTLQGVDPTTDPYWKPEPLTIAQASVIADLRNARNRVAKRIRQGRIGFAISSYETQERYAAELDQKVEFRNVNRFDAGWDFTDFFGRPWFMDHTAPDARVFFVPQGRQLERYAVTDFIEFVDEGAGSMQLVPNKTVFDILLTGIYEYGIRRRNGLVSGVGMNW